jgi:Leucine-rich repeat (LRR) protein
MFDSSNCPNLRDLNLSHNNMSTLKGFGYLPHLRNLRLKANRIETLFYKPSPDEKNFRRGLFGLPGLEFLDVSFNQLAYLHGLQYSPLKELKTFLASNNEIVKIEHLDKLRML